MLSNENDAAVSQSYSRAQAITDGVLIDVTGLAKEAGFRLPVAVTAAAWADCIAWTNDDNARQPYQHESGRLWDLLFGGNALQTALEANGQLLFNVHRIPRDTRVASIEVLSLKLVAGRGDTGEPVLTIMQPDED